MTGSFLPGLNGEQKERTNGEKYAVLCSVSQIQIDHEKNTKETSK